MLKYLLLLFSLSAFSQQKTIDSLMRVYNSTSHDTIRLSAINDVLNYVTQEEAPFYNNKMLTLAEQNLKKTKEETVLYNKYLSYAVEGYYLKGVFAANMEQYDSALFFSDKAIEIDLKNQNEELIVNCKMTKANIYITKGLYTNSTTLLYQVLNYFEKSKNFEGIGDIYLHLGRIYNMQRNYKKSIALFEKSYTNYELVNYSEGMIDVLNKLAITSMNMKNHSETVKYLNQSVLLSNKIGIKENVKQQQMLNSSLGYLAMENKDYKKAINYFEKSITQAKISNNTYVLSAIYLAIARCFYYENNYKTALSNAQNSMNINIKNNDLFGQKIAANFFALVYKKTSNLKLAIKYNDLYYQLRDSIEKQENKKMLVELQLKHEFEKKELISKTNHEKEISKLNSAIEIENTKRKSWITILVFGLLLVVILSFYIYKHQKDKNTIEVQNSNLLRQKMLLSQMNPHFVFNSINSIQNYILNKKEDEAYNYLAKFSRLIRSVLNNSRENVLPLSVELETLNLYIELEQLRFDDVFEYNINIAEGLDLFDVEIPTMLIQPYVENAIWHGLMNLKGERNGVLNIDIRIDGDLLRIVVEDNGIGRVRSGEFKKTNLHHSVAMKLTEQRLEMINKLENMKEVKVIVSDLYDEHKKACGTRVELFLPLTM